MTQFLPPVGRFGAPWMTSNSASSRLNSHRRRRLRVVDRREAEVAALLAQEVASGGVVAA
jgi:hypothetical protein